MFLYANRCDVIDPTAPIYCIGIGLVWAGIYNPPKHTRLLPPPTLRSTSAHPPPTPQPPLRTPSPSWIRDKLPNPLGLE